MGPKGTGALHVVRGPSRKGKKKNEMHVLERLKKRGPTHLPSNDDQRKKGGRSEKRQSIRINIGMHRGPWRWISLTTNKRKRGKGGNSTAIEFLLDGKEEKIEVSIIAGD